MPRESILVAHLATLCALTLGAALAACGPAAPTDSEPSARTAAPRPGSPGGGAKAHDFATLDICSLVPVTEVAEVPGLGDAAFLSRSGSFAQMNVLLEGEIYLDARAETPERARALAVRAIARLAD